MKSIKKRISLYLPSISPLGFKVINPSKSIIISFIFIFSDFILNPFFGLKTNQLIAGLLFTIIINFSIIILILNSILRIKNVNIFLWILEFLLIVYIPFSFKKIILCLASLYSLLQG